MRARILFWLLLPVLIAGCGGERQSVANGDPAPAFELERLDGGQATLSEQQGQVVALRFWADWCPFCRREMRELEPVYQQLRAEGLEILAVNVGQERARAERFADRVGYSYPTLLDPDSAVARRYGVIAIPVTYFIDRDGIVRGRILGESDASTFERMARPLLDPGADQRPGSAGTGQPAKGRAGIEPLQPLAAGAGLTATDP
ncbi:TlpA family protein disulfide reductase [Thioalkalivibrio paradoxus]|uniref:Cytochrome C biogenesis protein n=1 Tax=Thioalkalivibrio paradoxus ARh 1 TaxID=713585 RepID=W0DLS5_9GAMM|nr:TlpA disulfide reductase family protein [Thioalkalivibrio paradoxus]AHE99406.1 cytochrome C biogenesis protein [Thioalkalivibrio paradoxus ARh 1]